jgi:hypothetical protein
MRLYKTTSEAPYMSWAAAALHAATNDPVAIGAGPAPNPATGGGRGFAAGRVADAGIARGLALGEMMLLKALDAAAPEARDSEALGLLAHTLTRAGRPADAYAALLGKYAYLGSAPAAAATTAAAAASPTSPTTPAGGAAEEAAASPAPAPAPTADPAGEASQAGTADGKDGRGRSPGPFQPVDQLRYSAVLLAHAAARVSAGASAGTASGTVVAVTVAEGKAVADPAGGHAVGTWKAAQAAFGALVALLPDQAEDYAVAQGLAYTTAWVLAERVAAAADAAAVTAALAPLADATGDITGLAAVDAHLRPFAASSGAVNTANRTSALSVLLQQAVRCEIAARVVAAGGDAAKVAAASAALEAGAASYAKLLARYIASIGSKACCFGDIRPLLAPFAPATTAGAPATASSSSSAVSLAAFLNPEPAILSLPFSPVSAPGEASDVSASRPLFRFSFVVPAAATAAHLAPALAATRAADKPDTAFRASITAIVSAGRVAAAAAGMLDADGAPRRRKYDEKKGGAGAADETDPHGVAFALAPASELVLSAEQDKTLADARARVRRYTTALQVQRYIGALGLGSGASSSSATPAAVESARASVAELVAAWEGTLPLADAATGAGADGVNEGDDIVLLAAHLLWDVAFVLLGRAEEEAEGAAGLPHLFAGRQALIEASILMTAGGSLSAANPQFKSGLVRTYAWFGAGASMLTAYRTLRIKHITTDTLAHTVLPHVARSSWKEAVKALGEGA